MQAIVFGLLACAMLGFASSCSYMSPVFICFNIGNGLEEFLDMYDRKGRHADVLYVIRGHIGTFDTGKVSFSHENITLSQLSITDFAKPTLFSSMKKLKHLDLSGNKLRTIPSLPATLRVLDVSRNRLYATAGQAASFFSSIPSTLILKELRLSHNYLEFFTYKEGDLKNYKLSELDLSHNPLRSLDIKLPMIRKLNLSSTLLDSYELEITSLYHYRISTAYEHRQRVIDLSNGNFKTLDPPFLEKMIAYSSAANVTFNLKGNPWACSCMMKKARNILLAAADKVKAAWFDDVRCATPKKLAGRRLVDVAMSDLECDEWNTFWDCCYRVSLDKWETASAGCRVRGNPPPKVICRAGKSGVQIAAKTQANREDNLLMTFTALENKYVGEVGYVCEAYWSHFKGKPKKTMNCPYLMYNERAQEYVAGANSLHSPSTIFIPLILLLVLKCST